MINSPTLADRFTVVSAENVDRIAVQTTHTVWTYGELSERVAAVDAVLRRFPGRQPVAVMADGSLEAVAQLVAVTLSEHPAVLIDTALPTERVAAMMRAVGATTLHASRALEKDNLDSTAWQHFPPDTAIVAFTSGSTGAPKAVLHPQALWLNQVSELATELTIGPGHRAGQALPVSYGAGLDITLTALMNGATLQLLDVRGAGVAATLQTLSRWEPDSLHLTPSLWRALSVDQHARTALSSVRVVATCGEAVHGGDLARARALLPAATFVNRSGSSETGNLAFNTFPPDRPMPDTVVPAGRPARDKSVVIVDDVGMPLPEGEIGNIEVTSPHLALGYVLDGRVHLFTETARGRRHVLGDRGRCAGGELHLLGRTDDTVKVRGYRVDTGEITAVARAIDGILDAVVTVRQVEGTTRIAAYLVAAPGRRPPSLAEIRVGMAAVLPDWMQPTHVTLLPALPMTERGKIDKAALPDPVERPRRVAPATTTERLLAPIYEDLFAVGDIGVTDDVVALGADSLTIVELIRRIQDTFGVDLAPSVVFAGGTLGDLAQRIDDTDATPGTTDVVVELNPRSPAETPRTSDPPSRIVFAFAGAGEAALALSPLARRLPGTRVVGLQAHGLESRGLPDWTITRAARRCVRHITEIDPIGPYVFVGHSLGGVIAMEAARILDRHGRSVEHIVCLDTVLHGPLANRSSIPMSPDESRDQRTDQVDETILRPSGSAVWRTRAALLTAGWWRRPAQAQWALFHELGRRSAMLHRLRPYTGAVTAVLAEDNPDDPRWWYRLAPSCTGVHRVAGDHNGMLRAPYVDATAAIVGDVLAAVRT